MLLREALAEQPAATGGQRSCNHRKSDRITPPGRVQGGVLAAGSPKRPKVPHAPEGAQSAMTEASEGGEEGEERGTSGWWYSGPTPSGAEDSHV